MIINTAVELEHNFFQFHVIKCCISFPMHFPQSLLDNKISEKYAIYIFALK